MTKEMAIKNGCIKLDASFLLEERKWLLEFRVADVRFKVLVPDPNDPNSSEIQLISVQDPYKSSFSLPATRMARRKKFEIPLGTTTTIIQKIVAK